MTVHANDYTETKREEGQRPADVMETVEPCGSAVAPAAGSALREDVTTKKRSRAASKKIVADDLAEELSRLFKGFVPANDLLEVEHKRSLSKSPDVVKSAESDGTVSTPAADSKANVQIVEVDDAISKDVTEKFSEEPPCLTGGMMKSEMEPNRIVVRVEVHAAFDDDPRGRDSPARQLPRNNEMSLGDRLERQRQLAMAIDWHDDLLVIDDGSPVEFHADMLVWYMPKGQSFWPAVIENEVDNKFSVRLLACESVNSTYVVPKEKATQVFKPYPGNDYLALTAGEEITLNPSPFIAAVKTANKYMQERQCGRITIGPCEYIRRLEMPEPSS